MFVSGVIKEYRDYVLYNSYNQYMEICSQT